MDQNCLEKYLILQKCKISELGNSIYDDLSMGRRCKNDKIDDWKLSLAMHHLLCGHQIESNTECISKDKVCNIIYFLNDKLGVCDC